MKKCISLRLFEGGGHPMNGVAEHAVIRGVFVAPWWLCTKNININFIRHNTEFELAHSFFSSAWECHNKGNRAVVKCFLGLSSSQAAEGAERGTRIKMAFRRKISVNKSHLLCLFAELSDTRSPWLWILRAAGMVPAWRVWFYREQRNKLELRIEKKDVCLRREQDRRSSFPP